MNKFNELMAIRLHTLRREYNYKQDFIARELKISQQAYSKLEKGQLNFTPSHIVKICEVFKIKIEDFLQNEKGVKIINSPQANMHNSSVTNDTIVITELIASKNQLIESLYAQIELLRINYKTDKT
jgi:transcriptional regulator with XRE-family HTH domain